MTVLNHQFRLATRPTGLPKASDWNYVTEPVRDLQENELLIKNFYISLDPAMRGWMNEGESYVPAIKIGEVMRALAVGKIIASKHPQFSEGEFVSGAFGIQEYTLSNGENITKVNPNLAPLPVYLSALGMTGLTAYFGLIDVGQVKENDTVVISGAAGAVGMIAGQIAKIKGCRVIGIAGSDEKCAYLTNELGFDAAINYKKEKVRKSLKKHCPNGINVYFDNVGGSILDDALSLIALHARVVLCGAISQYNQTDGIKGPANYLSLLIKRARMEGFIIFDYKNRFHEGIRDMANWISAGKLKSREDIVEGLETFPDTFLKLFSGENTGKLMLKIADA